MIHTVGYTIRALPNGRSHVSICVFGAVHLVVEATLDAESSRVSPPATLVRRHEGGEDRTAEECDGSCQDSIKSVRLTVELRDRVEVEVRSATRELFARLERAKLAADQDADGSTSGTGPLPLS